MVAKVVLASIKVDQEEDLFASFKVEDLEVVLYFTKEVSTLTLNHILGFILAHILSFILAYTLSFIHIYNPNFHNFAVSFSITTSRPN